MTVTRAEWAGAFLDRIDKPRTHENLTAVLAWIRSEFGASAPIPADWNPLATTTDLKPNTRYNSVGVRNYPDFAHGVEANAHTIENGAPGYSAILGALAQADDANRTVHAIHASAWGSKPTDEILSYTRTHLDTDARLAVGGTSSAPPPPPHEGAPPFPGRLLRDYTSNHGTATWQAQMLHRGWRITVDDRYGPQSAAVCEAFQREKGLTVDGIVGPHTWAAAWTAPVT